MLLRIIAKSQHLFQPAKLPLSLDAAHNMYTRRLPVCRDRLSGEHAASANNPPGKDHILSASKINDRAVRGNVSAAQSEATVDRVRPLRRVCSVRHIGLIDDLHIAV